MINIPELHAHLKEVGFMQTSYDKYGGITGCIDYGYLGCYFKKKVIHIWKDIFITKGVYEIDTPILTPEIIYAVSGHTNKFIDYVAVSGKIRHRADHLIEDLGQVWNNNLTDMEKIINDSDTIRDGVPFHIEEESLMWATQDKRFLRPELAQHIILTSSSINSCLPFAIASVGEAFRREISCKPYTRLAQFTLAEIEHLYHDMPNDYVDLSMYTFLDRNNTTTEPEHPLIRHYIALISVFMQTLGINTHEYRFRQHKKDELSHYAADCWDLEIKLGDKWLECAGIADRSDYDCLQHNIKLKKKLEQPIIIESVKIKPNGQKLYELFNKTCGTIVSRLANNKFTMKDDDIFIDDKLIPKDCYNKQIYKRESYEELVYPKIIEPSFGIDRICYAILLNRTWKRQNDEKRLVMSIPNVLSFYDVAIAQLINSDDMINYAMYLADVMSRNGIKVQTDLSSTSIGKRYVRADKIGIPYALTIENRSINDSKILTLRDRDTTKQYDIHLPHEKDIYKLCYLIKTINSAQIISEKINN